MTTSLFIIMTLVSLAWSWLGILGLGKLDKRIEDYVLLDALAFYSFYAMPLFLGCSAAIGHELFTNHGGEFFGAIVGLIVLAIGPIAWVKYHARKKP